ncbi:TPA: proline--tRNA ligase [Patescibacteria group bacterium]|nr:proline--tRNA ligase [Patescibacteria group bacterium]
MKYSQIFTKTDKNAKQYDSVNATLLIKGGFIDQTMSGVYTFLPLGNRILRKIENIVREEMDKIGVEILMPGLSPKEAWINTGRLEEVDNLFKVSGANELSRRFNSAEYILNPTHEEIVTPLAKKFRRSYKDFPFALYQIQTKYRNEARPKSGLLRGREFIMKDLYSFHTSIEDFREYYEKVKQSYWNIFEKLGIKQDTVLAAASGGTFTTEFSHEFQTKCDNGEDLIFQVPSTKEAFNREVASSKAPEVPQDSEMKKIEYKNEPGVIGVEDLCRVFNIEANQSVKTLIFETDSKEQPVVIVALRGDYDINEIKLMKIISCTKIRLASDEVVKRVTGAKIGYAGIVNLQEGVPVYLDDAIEPLINFECGGNRTDYHILNVNWGRDVEKPKKFYDIKIAKEGDLFCETNEVYDTFKASEVGNIFPLFDKFTKVLKYTFIDKDGSEKPILMGCYGLGITRVLGVLVEKCHDENGIVWPYAVAPFHIQLLHIGDDGYKRAKELERELETNGFEVLWDDRDDISAGEKFVDADLIGCPFRIVVSDRTLSQESVEVKKRNESESSLVALSDLIPFLKV